MIEIKDVELLDLLPYTFKTDEYKALSKAIKALTSLLYTQMSTVLFWADIENADGVLLDAMAAELDAQFYSSDMSDDKKRSVILAAFEHNSRIGTVSSITDTLTAVFGRGAVSEWYRYGGEPYKFKVSIDTNENYPEYDKLPLVLEHIEKNKNKRSVLETVQFQTKKSTKCYVGTALQSYNLTTLQVPGVSPAFKLITDESGILLTDENELWLFEEE